jgi:hypothetical protein
VDFGQNVSGLQPLSLDSVQQSAGCLRMRKVGHYDTGCTADADAGWQTQRAVASALVVCGFERRLTSMQPCGLMSCLSPYVYVHVRPPRGLALFPRAA